MSGSVLSISRLLGLLVCAFGLNVAQAETANIAVAANFKPAMEPLAAAFERDTGHDLQVSYGSTGQFFAQIRLGAPFDLFLAADTERPKRLSETYPDLPVPRAYAIGRLALWAPRLDAIDDSTFEEAVRFLAIANENLAPYGAAAVAVLRSLGIEDRFKGKIVRGSNVAQAFVFTQSANADLGFVAFSQILLLPPRERGAFWLPPQELYPPIQQDALLLESGVDNAAAAAFFDFLFSDQARAIVEDAGYNLP
jgi:molybdate transport system substrate-binding protein